MFSNMIHKDRHIIDKPYDKDSNLDKLIWSLRMYSETASFVKHIKNIETILFSLDERERYKHVITMVGELLQDKEMTMYKCYLSKKLEGLSIDKVKEYIYVLLAICNTLHPKKYYILHNISKDIF